MKTRVLSVLLAGIMAFSAAPQIADPVTTVAVAATKLAAPKGITATINDTSVKLKWNKVKGASGYRVYKYNAKTKKFEKYKNVSGTSCTVKSLTAGTTYRFKIAALVKSNGKLVEQTQSNGQSVTTKLSAPKNLKATVSGTSIKLTWSKVKGASGYRILIYDSVTKQYCMVKSSFP